VRRFAVLLLCVLAFPASAQAWTWPVDGPVLRPFVFDPAHPYAGGQHRGIDLGAREGTSVRAPAGGIVTFVGSVPGGGKTIAIETPSGYSATLLHLGTTVVTRGATVAEADVVGTSGPDAFVYFGVRVAADPQGYVDPLSLLPPRAEPAPGTDPGPAAEVAPEPNSVGAAPAPAAAAPVTGSSAPPDAGVGQQPVAPVADDAGSLTTAEADTEHDQAEGRGDPAAADDAARGRGSDPVVSTTTSVVRPRGAHAVVHVHADGKQRAAARPGPPELEQATSLAHGEGHDASASPAETSATARSSSSSGLVVPALSTLVALIVVATVYVRRRASKRSPRIIATGTSSEQEPTADRQPAQEDSRRARVAVCERPAASRPHRGVRGSGRHLRAVPAIAGERGPDGEWDRRARDADDGRGRQGGRLAA